MSITLKAGFRPPGQAREWEVLGGRPPVRRPGATKGGCRLKKNGSECAHAARGLRRGVAANLIEAAGKRGDGKCWRTGTGKRFYQK